MMTKLRALLCLGVATTLAACGGSGVGDDADQVGTTEQALAPAGSNAIYVPGASTFPASFFPGERRYVVLTMQNTGLATPANDWLTASPVYQLATRDGQWGWGWTPVATRTAPGGQASFTFIVTAPNAPVASQPFAFQMRAGTVDFFGAQTTLTPSISNATVPDWGCKLISSTVPPTMTPGETRTVSITVQNSGSKTWTPAANFVLTSRDTPVNFWQQVSSPVTAPVAPGGNATFTFGIGAPTTTGSYTFKREMKGSTSGPGDFRSLEPFCLSTTIMVGGTPAYDASIVSTSFPPSVTTGAFSSGTIVLKNTGTQTWLAGLTAQELFSQNSPASLWGLTQVATPQDTMPGQNATFTFGFQAPATAGAYAQRWQMRNNSGANAGYFGALVNVPITVTAGTPNYNATVISQTIPPLMTVGKNYTFSITMQNSGSSAWNGNHFQFWSTASPQNLWFLVHQDLGASEIVNIGANKVFSLPVIAPSTPGTYSSSWRMRSTDFGYFGATALTTGLIVTNCGNSVIDSGENCDDGNLNDNDGCSSQCQQEQIAYDTATPGSSSRTVFGSGLQAALASVTVGDVTGDGTPEVFTSEFQPPPAIGVMLRNGAGAVYGFAGGAGFLNGSTTTIPTGSTVQIAGVDAADHLGTSNSGRTVVGEVSGDAIPDLILTAPDADGPMNGRVDCGEIYVLTGSAGLISAGFIDLAAAPSQQRAHIIGKNAGDHLLAAAVGDLTGDGQPDLVVGSPAGTGTLYIIPGGASLAGEIDLATPPAGVITVVGGTSADHITAPLAVGDLNADGVPDLLVGASNAAPGGKTRAGAAYAKFGPITTNQDFAQAVGSATGASVRWLGQNAFDGLGITVAIGNVTGTATGEALIGGIQYQRSPGVQSGGVHIWSGITSGTTFDLSAGATPTARIIGADAHDDCGTSLALGDMNNDGYKDIMFACSAASGPGNTRSKSGEVNVVFGAATLPVAYDLLTLKSRMIIYGDAVNSLLGRTSTGLAGADINGDGKADLCAGSLVGGGSAHPGRLDCFSSPF